MRKSSIAATTIMGLSAFAASLLVGQQQEVQALSLGSPLTSESSTPSPTSSGGATSGPTAGPTTGPTESPSPTPSDTTPATSGKYHDGKYTSSIIKYKYGVMELGVTVAGGNITAIDLIQASTTGRGYDKAPPVLVDAAIKTQGTNFGNLTGATFATQAFKKALENALSQAQN